MKRLQSVENALIDVNDVVFQELCDSFLVLRNKNYSAFSRTGSQSGKQKSTKGTPDSFKLLPNGKYIFIEHTTVSSSQKSKLLDDIEKCLDEEKTKISTEDIAEIILCTNFNLGTEDINELRSKLDGKYINLELYTLDRLSIELFHQHPNLCHQYLGLPLDTGQIVSIEQFIDEYDKAAKNIATPINNEFVHRDNEIKQLIGAIKNSDFIIITGSPGVGKTKLALEGIKKFLSENHNYYSYCVSFKSASLIEDLYQHFDSNLDYVLFVDDANRIDFFNQIVGFYKKKRKGNLKIIITVRDYALNEVAPLCLEFNPAELLLKKLSDEQIIDILKSDSFKIYNQDYHKEIVRIADGNPRLAIMTARLAIEKQNLQALADVSDLFEHYFTKFISDNVDFTNTSNLQSLGLISFFHTIPYKDKTRCTQLLNKFNINYNDFIESIDYLNKLELVDLQFEYAKISEQNLATYFFYRTFIKDELLSFGTLLDSYYDSNMDRFRDTIIPANNTFGYENVIKKVKPILLKYWNTIKSDEEKAFNILSTFWFYLDDESIELVYNHISRLSEPHNPKYSVHYETNQFAYKRDRIFELIGNFFNYPTRLKESLELGFEYSRKNPETLPELIYTIRERLLFDTDDNRMGFKRQEILISLLLEKCEKSEYIFEISFPAIAVSFLQYKYQHTKGGRNHSFYWYQYPFPLNSVTENIRKKIWLKIDNDFHTNTESFFQLLTQYSQRTPDVVKEVMEFDVRFVLSIINKHLTNSNFEHCCYVQEQIHWFIKNDISNEEFNDLKRKFINERYLVYLKVDWDRLRDKDSYEFANYKEYEKLKEIEVRESFVFEKIDEFIDFYEHYKYLLEWEKNTYRITNSFDLIIDENFKINFEIGVKILEYIINNNNELNYIPYLPLRNLLSANNNAQVIWNIISRKDFNHSVSWQLQYFSFLDETLVSEVHCNNLLSTIQNINDHIFVHFPDLTKYLKYDDKLFVKILKIIVEKRKNENLSIRITHNYFSQNSAYLSNDINTVKEAYMQQNIYDPHYDYDGTELLSILKIDKSFLLEYIKYLYEQKDKHRSYEYKSLAIVWLVEDIEDVLTDVFDFISEKEIYMGILDHFCNSFFTDIKKEENIKRSNKFIVNYIDNNFTAINKMNMIVDVLRHSKTDFFEEAYIHYLELTQDVNIYSKIWWTGNGESGTGYESIGEKMALKWRNVLEITNKVDLGIKLIPIKKYINDQIEDAMDYAENEKRRRFLDKF